ncbi:hypothetical protein OESDEN_14738, partial [Oesophagostomum dentatum]
YLNYPHTANNLFIVVLTCLLYVQYSRVLLRYSKVGAGLSWAQRSFLPTPSYFVLIGHICWQLGHGFPAIVYLILNRTIQREVLEMIGLHRRASVKRLNRPSTTRFS